MDSLGRVLDPSALDTCNGARARLRVNVPAEWLVEGGKIELAAPERLACARCDGGGCDGCARSGVLRAPANPGARTLQAHIPSGAPPALALRIPRPFGADHEVTQLLLELRAAPGPSAGVKRVEPPPRGVRPLLPWLALAAVVLTLVALVAVLWAR